MRSRRFRIAVISAFIAVLFGLVGLAISVYRSSLSAMRDIYVPVSAADLVIAHMTANDGHWPKSWDELHKTFLSVQSKNGIYEGFRWEEYPRRVGIDFIADPAKLASAKERQDEPPFRVIWSLAHPERECPIPPIEPNRKLFQYLRTQTSSKSASRDDYVPPTQTESP